MSRASDRSAASELSPEPARELSPEHTLPSEGADERLREAMAQVKHGALEEQQDVVAAAADAAAGTPMADLESRMAGRLASLQAQLEERIDAFATKVEVAQGDIQMQLERCLVSLATRLDREKLAYTEAMNQLWDAVVDVGTDVGDLTEQQQESCESCSQSIADLTAMLDKVMAEQEEAGHQHRFTMEAIADIHTQLQSLSADQVEICRQEDTLLASVREELDLRSVISAEHEQSLRECTDGLRKGHADLEQRLRELVEFLALHQQSRARKVHGDQYEEQREPHDGHSCERSARCGLVDEDRVHPRRSHPNTPCEIFEAFSVGTAPKIRIAVSRGLPADMSH